MDNKWAKVMLYSLVAIALFTAFFYFYSAAIFEAEIIELTGSAYQMDVSLKAFFDTAALPKAVSVDLVKYVNPTIKGWLLLVICLVGTPIMIGYRLATTNPEKKKDMAE